MGPRDQSDGIRTMALAPDLTILLGGMVLRVAFAVCGYMMSVILYMGEHSARHLADLLVRHAFRVLSLYHPC